MLNPIQGMANITDQFRSRAHTGVTAKVDGAIQAAKQQLGVETKYVDVTIQVGWQCRFLNLVLDLKRWHGQFIGASKLPKMEVIGTTDPFFHASLDHRLSYMHVSPRFRARALHLKVA